MADPKEIEGSAERAKDRGRADALDFGTGKVDLLNEPEVVEGLVRQFLGEIVDTRTAYHKDEITGIEAAARTQASAAKYASIFMGGGGGYQPLPWNSVDGLGQSLAAVNGEPPESAAEAFFLRLAADFLSSVVIPHESDEIDDEQVQFRSDAIVEDALYALLGLRQDDQQQEP